MKSTGNIVEWVFKLAIAGILLQTLYFKFLADQTSVELFSKLGAEPFGRIGSGIVELIASILLFVPKRIWLGASIALGTMAGAILAHLTILGIDYPDGVLFYLALAVFFMSAVVLFRNKKQIPFLGL